MTACSLLRLLILTQPSKLIFFISGQLATNCLGLVAKGFFWHQNIFIPFISINRKKVNKKSVLEIALNTFCFIIGGDI